MLPFAAILVTSPRSGLQAGTNMAMGGGRLWQEDDCVLCGNIRIDNGPELRQSLGRSSGEDGALVLAAWRRWGTDCPAHLVGDFAFMLWDQEGN